MNRFNFYPGDWIRDTVELTAKEEGIYLRLLNWYYANEKPIPDDRAHMITRENPTETQWVLNRFFIWDGSTWRHKRCDAEIEKAQKAINAARTNGKLGGRPKKDSPEITQSVPNGLTQTEPSGNPDRKLPPPSPVPIREEGSAPPFHDGAPVVDLDLTPSQLPVPRTDGGDKKPRSPRQRKEPKVSDAKGAPVWREYIPAYRARYGKEPIRNQSQNTAACQIIDKIGKADAGAVAAFYVSLNSSWYVQKGHTLKAMVVDAEKLHTDWATGRRSTQTAARQGDEQQAKGDTWQKAIEKVCK